MDDFGESLLSSVERQQVLSFPTIPKKHVIAIARNIFDPGNLPYLDNLILDDLTSDVTISFEDGKMKLSKNVGKASAFKTLAIWSKNFITYVQVVSIFHGVKYPQIVRKLLEFHNTIVELSQTYDWQKSVLPLALLFHRTALHKGFTDSGISCRVVLPPRLNTVAQYVFCVFGVRGKVHVSRILYAGLRETCFFVWKPVKKDLFPAISRYTCFLLKELVKMLYFAIFVT